MTRATQIISICVCVMVFMVPLLRRIEASPIKDVLLMKNDANLKSVLNKINFAKLNKNLAYRIWKDDFNILDDDIDEDDFYNDDDDDDYEEEILTVLEGTKLKVISSAASFVGAAAAGTPVGTVATCIGAGCLIVEGILDARSKGALPHSTLSKLQVASKVASGATAFGTIVSGDAFAGACIEAACNFVNALVDASKKKKTTTIPDLEAGQGAQCVCPSPAAPASPHSSSSAVTVTFHLDPSSPPSPKPELNKSKSLPLRQRQRMHTAARKEIMRSY